MGEVEVPADDIGARRRSADRANFPIGGHRFRRPVIRAFGLVKKAAALTNELGELDPRHRRTSSPRRRRR